MARQAFSTDAGGLKTRRRLKTCLQGSTAQISSGLIHSNQRE